METLIAPKTCRMNEIVRVSANIDEKLTFSSVESRSEREDVQRR